MCGIVGVAGPTAIAPETVLGMRDQLAHRGPDHAGLWSSGDSRVCLGHRRLSIIDLDARSNQPMQAADGQYVITFNGEIYNYRAVRARLVREGTVFRTNCDTEVVLEGYRRYGANLLDLLSGMFAFAIWDAAKSELFCARDRAGEKPFHYALVDGTFVFASEIKAILDWPGLARRLDPEALIDFLSFGFVADPKSIWLDVRKLPPAHYMVVSLRPEGARLASAPRRYWSLDFRPGSVPVDPEQIRQTLLRAADEMAIGDVSLGTFLSGGVDSSTVTAAVSRSGRSVQSFTVGFDDPHYDERPWARVVAARYHTRHVERIVDPADVSAVFDRLAWHFDEPFGDYSAFPTYYLCREARRSITIALSGDGADEVFAGYSKYQRLARRAQFESAVPRGVSRAVEAALAMWVGADGRRTRTLRQYVSPAAHMLADSLCIGFPMELLRQVARGPLADALRRYDPTSLIDRLLVDAPPDEVGLVNSMRHLDFLLTLPGGMLVKVDRASMAVSLEVRPLFLHREVMELAARIPAGKLASPVSAKMALKDAVRPWLPDAVLDRRKQGFAMPLPGWLGQDSALGRQISAIASDSPLAEFLDLDRIAALRSAHQSGKGDYTAILYSTFVLDRWFRQWLPR